MWAESGLVGGTPLESVSLKQLELGGSVCFMSWFRSMPFRKAEERRLKEI